MVTALDPFRKVADELGALLIVDAVASLAAEPMHVDEQRLDIVFSGTQKALSAHPGMSPITIPDPSASGKPSALAVVVSSQTGTDCVALCYSAVANQDCLRRQRNARPELLFLASKDGAILISQRGSDSSGSV